MPGINGGLDAGEVIRLFRREFAAEDLGRAGEELLRGEERCQREVTVGDDGLPGLRYFHLDIVAECDFKSPFRTLLEVVDCRRGYLYRGG